MEWGVAEATGSAADAFLGTQGDVWDTQWDMLLALGGAIISLISIKDNNFPLCSPDFLNNISLTIIAGIKPWAKCPNRS
ncbi:DUF2238 domain-containing protein [Desulfosporosinus sp. I2]|uniref:DUF2238 domain-containing protein n=1 Tax=Desulfosporosinus sp. I2 TaxID=1617025 RepID=UPI001FA80991|nr:DUF2238 domain-containing protein [Desulfosporosinus sp. I2]